MELLTGKAKEDFLDWLDNIQLQPQDLAPYRVTFDEVPLIVKIAYIIEWLDSKMIYVKIKPYHGGGQNVFYPSCYFLEEYFIIRQVNILFDDDSLFYTTDRTEATTEAIKKANEIYNEKHD